MTIFEATTMPCALVRFSLFGYRPKLGGFALGVLADLMLMMDERHAYLLLVMAALLLFSYVLESSAQGSRDESLPQNHEGAAHPGGSLRPSIPMTILLGAFAAHSALLIRDISADPTSHNLWPFEFAMLLVFFAPPVLLSFATAALVRYWLQRAAANLPSTIAD